jgi:hypothetical protein
MAERPADWRWTRRAVLGVSVMLVLTGCASSARPAPPPSAPVAHGSSGAPSASSSASPVGTRAQNLVAGSSVKAALLAAFVAAKGLPQDEVTGPLPGTLYYGLDSSTGTYWAVARFGLTSSAPAQAAVDMQDGFDTGVFSRHGDQAWTVRPGGIPFPCPGELPADLMSVWGMTSSGSCIVASANSPARAQATIANALDLPAGIYFGVVLYEELQLDGSGAILFEPETWQGTSTPASGSHAFFLLGLTPSTVAGYWTGTSRSASQEVLGSFDLAFADRVQGAMVPFLTQPLAGYEVTVSVPEGCSGACSEATKIIQMNSVAPLPANPDFTIPPP